MIPILYESNETNFSSNGLGRLRDCIRFECIEERNGIYEIEFDYPITGAHYTEIIPGRIVAATHDESGNVEPFDIYAYSRPINGIVTFKGQHISYRLRGSVVTGQNITSLVMALSLLDNATPNMNFDYGAEFDASGYMSAANGTPRTVRELLGGVEGSILDTYGGEYEFTRFHIHIWQNRGKVKEFIIRYGSNLTDYNEDVDFSETFTAAIPYWVNGDDIVIGSKVDSYSESYNGREICLPLNLTDKFESKPTAEALSTFAQNYLLSVQPALPLKNIKVDFIKLQDTEEYKQYSNLQKCKLCDSVKVVFPMYDMEGYFKIVRTVWDVLLEQYSEIELGNLSTSLAQALGIK